MNNRCHHRTWHRLINHSALARQRSQRVEQEGVSGAKNVSYVVRLGLLHLVEGFM